MEAEKAEKAAKLAEEKSLKAAKPEGKTAKSVEKAVVAKAVVAKAVVAEKAKAEKKTKVAKEPEALKIVEVVEPVKKVTVSRITINGVQYLKTSANLLYNPDTKEEVGIYDPETETIKALPDEEEDESEYDSE